MNLKRYIALHCYQTEVYERVEAGLFVPFILPSGSVPKIDLLSVQVIKKRSWEEQPLFIQIITEFETDILK